MDKKIIDTNHITIYFSTLQIGLGISFISEHKELSIMLGVIEIIAR